MPNFFFNSSHSKGCALYAFAAGGADVGIDIEQTRTFAEADAVAELILSARERARYDSIPEDSRALELLRFWTAKEACAKAAGLGLHLPFRDLTVDLDDGATAWGPIAWRISDLSAHAPGHVAFVASTTPRQIKLIPPSSIDGAAYLAFSDLLRMNSSRTLEIQHA